MHLQPLGLGRAGQWSLVGAGDRRVQRLDVPLYGAVPPAAGGVGLDDLQIALGADAAGEAGHGATPGEGSGRQGAQPCSDRRGHAVADDSGGGVDVVRQPRCSWPALKLCELAPRERGALVDGAVVGWSRAVGALAAGEVAAVAAQRR